MSRPAINARVWLVFRITYASLPENYSRSPACQGQFPVQECWLWREFKPRGQPVPEQQSASRQDCSLPGDKSRRKHGHLRKHLIYLEPSSSKTMKQSGFQARSRSALQRRLRGAVSEGADGILILSGSHPAAGISTTFGYYVVVTLFERSKSRSVHCSLQDRSEGVLASGGRQTASSC